MNTPIVEILEVEPQAHPVSATGQAVSIEIADTSPRADESAVNTHTVYRLNPGVREKLARIQLPEHCWRLLHQINGRRDVATIAEQLNTAPSELGTAIQRMLCQGLILEADAMSLEQFRKLSRPARPAPPPPVDPPKADDTTSAARDDSASGTGQPDAGQPGAEAGKSPADQIDSLVGHPRLLACLMDQVRKSRGGGRRGELAVYLMFTRVPAELFRNAGLRSYLYVDEETRIEDPRLTSRLLHEAELIVGRALAPAIGACLRA